MRLMGFLLICGLIVGCQTTRAPSGPPEYQSGFKAGCDSGYVASGHPYYRFHKDHNAFANSQLYKSGWNDGFATCKGRYDSIQRY